MNIDQIKETEKSEISLADENTALKAELEALRASIESSRKKAAEEKELSELFPGISLDDVPAQVFEYAENNGSTLAGAYAVYHRRTQLEKERADKRALENALKTPGGVSGASSGALERLFTAEEIRSMNREQVRKNYKQIMKSLKYGK